MTNIEHLRRAELTNGLSEAQLQLLATIAREFSLRSGEILFRLGDEADTIFVVVSGSVQLTIPLKVVGEERDIVIETLAAGDSLAWSSMIAPHRLTTSARATASSQLIGFVRSDLLSLLDDVPEVGYVVMTNLANIMGRRLIVTNAMWVRELQRTVREKFG